MEETPRPDSTIFADDNFKSQAQASEMDSAKSPISIEMDPPTRTEDVQKDFEKLDTLGSIQLHNEAGEVILIPTPSSDPNDPLNW